MGEHHESGSRRRYPHRDPVPDDDPRYGDPRRCGHWTKQGSADWYRRSDGSRCLGWCITGTKQCKRHAGKRTAVAVAEGKVVAEFSDPVRWGLGDANIDPADVLLRLVTQAAARCDLYASLLQDAYEVAERLKGVAVAGLPEELLEANLTAQADLKRIFSAGGVAALVGNTYAATKDGDIYATGEAIRGLALLEAAERDRCAGFAAKAVAAGLAERQVAVAEKQVEMVSKALSAALAEMGLGQDRQREAIRRVGGHLRIAAG